MNHTGYSFFNNRIFIVISASIFFLSCTKHEIPGDNFLSLDKTNARLDTLPGSSGNIAVGSSVPWTAVSSSGATEWLQLDKISGSAGNTAIKLSSIRNNGTASPGGGIVMAGTTSSIVQ
jgi:hypothetical protein